EEIVGEITDEHDREGPRIEELPDGSVRVTARLPVDELAELFGVEIEDDDDVETVGGLLAQALGRVPIPGATATVAGLTLVAEGARGRRNRVATLLVRPAEEVAVDGATPAAASPVAAEQVVVVPPADGAAESPGDAPGPEAADATEAAEATEAARTDSLRADV
ncbi:MAG: magnesium and cobalt exporter, family, partial [Actinomycetota bacterium]|nr:magnesium and cobalt exporter, family [Actinomycetota bacterium]